MVGSLFVPAHHLQFTCTGTNTNSDTNSDTKTETKPEAESESQSEANNQAQIGMETSTEADKAVQTYTVPAILDDGHNTAAIKGGR